MSPRPLVSVLLEGVRSAEPPIVSGRAALIASSASSEALRVATLGGFSASPPFRLATASPSARPRAACRRGGVGRRRRQFRGFAGRNIGRLLRVPTLQARHGFAERGAEVAGN